jgi:hypothetical protein
MKELRKFQSKKGQAERIMDYIVGYTGFVGSNLAASHNFDGRFNTKNIEESYGGNPDLLVYSGVPAEMFLANKNPAADRALMDTAIENIKKINPKKLVLISTIAVYQNPDNVDEDYEIVEKELTAYGANRRYLESWVQEHIPEHLIVRLPGLYGKNLKKNFLYDFIHYIPPMLNEAKFEELTQKERKLCGTEQIKAHYIRQDNGFYKCDVAQDASEEAKRIQKELKETFQQVGFSALNFTDSRGLYQYYNLANLWTDIEKALANGIRLLNLAVEPVTAAAVYEYLTGETFVNELPKAVPHFNYKTKYADLWGGEDGYIRKRAEVLADIKKFVEEQMA